MRIFFTSIFVIYLILQEIFFQQLLLPSLFQPPTIHMPLSETLFLSRFHEVYSLVFDDGIHLTTRYVQIDRSCFFFSNGFTFLQLCLFSFLCLCVCECECNHKGIIDLLCPLTSTLICICCFG
uniref:(northern house mosquito) hypothetical protein n=1 Tax=Culex pipiens TaxID=7175 RepID=A0A8D8DBX4_CULPI